MFAILSMLFQLNFLEPGEPDRHLYLRANSSEFLF
jgi:hypothetical protein